MAMRMVGLKSLDALDVYNKSVFFFSFSVFFFGFSLLFCFGSWS
jgi:hypothetical protein